jgi:PmbA protein
MDTLHPIADAALQALRSAGFEHAQVTAASSLVHELNAQDNEPSLLRSVQSDTLTLVGIVDGRQARTELTTPAIETLAATAARLLDDARNAPQDAAHAVSSGQQLSLLRGPQECDPSHLTAAMAQLLEDRRANVPKMHLQEAIAAHERRQFRTLSTGGSDLAGQVGWYSMAAMGTARDGTGRASSFNYAGGQALDLDAARVPGLFGIGTMMRDTARQIETQALGEKFEGEVVLAPNAVEDLLGWLLLQLSDTALLSGTSVYRDRVGEAIASPLLTVAARPDLPGVTGVSTDGFVVPEAALVQAGVLQRLLPSLYGSRKTGLPHAPSAGTGWDIEPGGTALAAMVGTVRRGALVGRLSMGRPASNGDFSGVIKNSFLLRDGEQGPALSETMITGNVATMLRDIVAVSRERLDGSGWRMPWLRVANLRFS